MTTKSGKKFVREIRYGKGHPNNPLSDKEIEGKFRRMADPLLGASQVTRIFERLWKLEEIKDLREMVGLFAVPVSKLPK